MPHMQNVETAVRKRDLVAPAAVKFDLLLQFFPTENFFHKTVSLRVIPRLLETVLARSALAPEGY